MAKHTKFVMFVRIIQHFKWRTGKQRLPFVKLLKMAEQANLTETLLQA